MKRTKKLKTIEEFSTGRNKRTIDLTKLTKKENSELIKKAEKGLLPGYHTVKQKGRQKFLRSNPDRKRKNNLDPKINL